MVLSVVFVSGPGDRGLIPGQIMLKAQKLCLMLFA